MFGNHGLGGLLKEGAHGKSPKCLGGNLGDFGGFWGILQRSRPYLFKQSIDMNNTAKWENGGKITIEAKPCQSLLLHVLHSYACYFIVGT